MCSLFAGGGARAGDSGGAVCGSGQDADPVPAGGALAHARHAP